MQPPDDATMRELARQRGSHADIEVDDDAVVSRGDDPGAYVACWVWVPFPDDDDDDE